MNRRLTTVVGTTVALLALGTTSAAAHECYNASRSDTGNAHAVNGQGLSSIDELYDILCDEGDALVQDAIDAAGFDPDGVLVNVNALMGAGKQATDGRAIDYLPPEVSQAIGMSFGVCFGG